MADQLYDIDMPRTSYLVIYGDDPIEEEEIEVVYVRPSTSWWCPCWA